MSDYRTKIHDPLLLRDVVKQGLEREAVRADMKGRIAQSPHPKAFGSPLTNPRITLDYAEAQLEFITPPIQKEKALAESLSTLVQWSATQVERELLWPFSMPPKLPNHTKIALADFGASADAETKRLYREGLKQRYGGAVQTISGIHYNFSLSESFWAAYAKMRGAEDIFAFQDEEYFAMMRNIVRYVPVVTYLFGASPAADKSFFKGTPKGLKKSGASTYIGEYATSLRLSDFGYHNVKRSPVAISYNSLSEYLDDLYRAISTPSKLWSALGVHDGKKQIQLNTNILQLENEFYASVRPKQKTHTVPDQSVLCSLACGGVEYLELRSIDLDPYEASGISEEELTFLHAFMVHCLLAPSPAFKKGEQKKWEDNNALVALLGRKPGLKVSTGSRKVEFFPWALESLKGVAEAAALLDEAHGTKKYLEAVEAQKEKIANPALTPSARVLREMEARKASYAQFGVLLAEKYAKGARTTPLPPLCENRMETMAQESVLEAKQRESRDLWILKGYEDLELSTQILIRAAKARGIHVDVLDWELNVIELTKGTKREVVKQATITRYDNYLSYELMNDKSLTKMFLARAGIATPAGERFTSAAQAIDFYAQNRAKALVVKPATTNYGTGVSIVEAHSQKAYETAVRRAFEHDTTVLVEEFIQGKEYRFLVIAGKVIAVLNRDPANVVGDGVHTISELVALKNADPRNFKLPKQHVRLGVVEEEILAEAGLEPGSVPKRGERVYLRKNSNVSDGGDPIDIADMPNGYKQIALKASKSVEANICGVDMIINNPKKKPTSGNHAIIELNWNPAIYLHGYPVKGKPRDVGSAILDFLGF